MIMTMKQKGLPAQEDSLDSRQTPSDLLTPYFKFGHTRPEDSMHTDCLTLRKSSESISYADLLSMNVQNAHHTSCSDVTKQY